MTEQHLNHDSDDEWRRPPPTDAQRRIDVGIGLALVAGSLIYTVLLNSSGAFPLGPPPSWWEQIAWSVAVALPITWRRRWPEAVTVITGAMFIAAQVRANSETLMASVALFCAIYTLGAWGRDRRWADRIRVGVILAMFVWLGISMIRSLVQVPDDAFPHAAGPLPPLLASFLYSFLFNVLFFLAAYFFGNTAWNLARRQRELEVQADALRRSQAENAERAVMDERVRIARELHDVVAHHVSVMGVQAGAARRVWDKNPEKAKAALGTVEQTARTAVDELRRMLGVLRQAGAPEIESHTAAPGLAHVEGLLDGVRQAGITTDYGVYGHPYEVPESVSISAYRIVQEALTNTLKHANARTVDVRIRYLVNDVEVEVTDDGRGARSLNGGGGGLGLIGMRERVGMHDGALEVGGRPTGGFRVRARFPLATGSQETR